MARQYGNQPAGTTSSVARAARPAKTMRVSVAWLIVAPDDSTNTTRVMSANASWCVTSDTSADWSGARLGLNAAFSRYDPLTIVPAFVWIAHPDGDLL